MRRVRRGVLRNAAAVPCVLLLLPLLGACGGGGDDEASDPAAGSSTSSSATSSPSSSPSASVPPGAPQCEDVWVEGADLPRSYDGCVDLDVFVPRDAVPCSSGQRLISYDDRFYGVAGGEVRVSDEALDDDADYRDALRSCTA